MESNDNTANSSRGRVPVLDTNISSKNEIPEWPISTHGLSSFESMNSSKLL